MSRSRKKNAAMPLADLVESYITHRIALRPKSANAYRWTLRAFENRLGRRAKLSDLTEESINAYVGWKLANYSASSAKRDRNSLVVWWRFAAKKKLVPTPPIDGIPTVKVPRKNAVAWTLTELEKLLETCSKLKGRMRQDKDCKVVNRHGVARTTGPERSRFWTSLILFLYDTGSRIGAALEVRPADLDLDRGFVTLRSETTKNGVEQILRLSRQTCDAIREIITPQSHRVWYWGLNHRRIWHHLTEILQEAGLPHDRYRKFHCLRKSTATLTAAAGRFDLAQTTLGHCSGYQTKNYVDQMAAPSQTAADVLPRPVFGNGQKSHETPQQRNDKPNSEASAKSESNGNGSFSTALSLIASLPLSEAEKADAVRKLVTEAAQVTGRHPTAHAHGRGDVEQEKKASGDS